MHRRPVMPGAPGRILVIEDRYFVRQVVVAILQECGYHAVGLGSAAEALRRLPDLDPTLILLDMRLPGMDGREFLERLRSDPRWGDLPVLIVSGFGEAAPPSPGRRLAVLPKPFDHGTLLRWVEQMLAPLPATAGAHAS